MVRVMCVCVCVCVLCACVNYWRCGIVHGYCRSVTRTIINGGRGDGGSCCGGRRVCDSKGVGMLIKRFGGEGEDTLTHLWFIGVASSVVSWVGRFVG